MDTREENILSLVEEHVGVLADRNHPDISDMADLNMGLVITINVIAHQAQAGELMELALIPQITAPYLKAAYGLGQNRGKGSK